MNEMRTYGHISILVMMRRFDARRGQEMGGAPFSRKRKRPPA
jgi:hypothetical protein